MSTFAGGFPLDSSDLNNGTGYYFAKEDGGGLIVINKWKRSDYHTNSNMVIMGVIGDKKSTQSSV